MAISEPTKPAVEAPLGTKVASGYMPQFDGMRGLAALSVVIAHFNPAPLEVAPGSIIGKFITFSRSVALGNLAVVFFFSLSAFLLTYLARREYATTGSFSAGAFILRRILRIWPLYFTIVAVAYLIQANHGAIRPEFGASPESWVWLKEHFMIFALFLGNWSLAFNHIDAYTDQLPSALRILWSIGVEEQFYLIYPMLILLLLRLPWMRAAIIAFVLLAAWGFRAWFSMLTVAPGFPPSAGGMYYATLSYGDVLLAGGIAGWLAAGIPIPQSVGLLRQAWLGPLLASLGLAVGMLWSAHLWYPYSLISIAAYSLAGVVFGLFLLWAWANPANPMMRLFAARPLRILGTLSYGIYMWHVISNTCLAAALNAWARETIVYSSPWLRLACSLGAATAFASLSWWVIERPFLKIKTRLRSAASAAP